MDTRTLAQRIVFPIIMSVILIAGGYTGYLYYRNFVTIRQQQRLESERAERIARNKINLIEALRGDGRLFVQEIEEGFWYSYVDEFGNSHVVYFDINRLAQINLSAEELAQMRAQIGSSTLANKTSVRSLTDEELPNDQQFHNNIYTIRTDNTFLTTKAGLEKSIASGTYDADMLWKLAYIYELEGRYADRNALAQKSCAEFKVRCDTETFTVSVVGTVVDIAGSPIQGASVSIISRDDSTTQVTGIDGTFTIPIQAHELEKVRVRAHKRNHSEGIASAVIVSKRTPALDVGPISLSAALDVVTIDSQAGTVTGANNRLVNDTFVLATDNSRYEIPRNAVVRRDGTPYQGPIDVYLYEFDQETVPTGLTEVDTFDDVLGFAGSLMQTFGMPYIQFFTQDGEELHVLKSNPMKLTYKITEMESLRNDELGFYGKLTDQDMEKLVRDSMEREYIIDRDYLIENDMLRFPAFWAFDRIRGVWDNIGVNVLDVNGTLETRFYTLRDI
jgi:hypothetical protein